MDSKEPRPERVEMTRIGPEPAKLACAGGDIWTPNMHAGAAPVKLIAGAPTPGQAGQPARPSIDQRIAAYRAKLLRISHSIKRNYQIPDAPIPTTFELRRVDIRSHFTNPAMAAREYMSTSDSGALHRAHDMDEAASALSHAAYDKTSPREAATAIAKLANVAAAHDVCTAIKADSIFNTVISGCLHYIGQVSIVELYNAWRDMLRDFAEYYEKQFREYLTERRMRKYAAQDKYDKLMTHAGKSTDPSGKGRRVYIDSFYSEDEEPDTASIEDAFERRKREYELAELECKEALEKKIAECNGQCVAHSLRMDAERATSAAEHAAVIQSAATRCREWHSYGYDHKIRYCVYAMRAKTRDVFARIGYKLDKVTQSDMRQLLMRCRSYQAVYGAHPRIAQMLADRIIYLTMNDMDRYTESGERDTLLHPIAASIQRYPLAQSIERLLVVPAAPITPNAPNAPNAPNTSGAGREPGPHTLCALPADIHGYIGTFMSTADIYRLGTASRRMQQAMQIMYQSNPGKWLSLKYEVYSRWYRDISGIIKKTLLPPSMRLHTHYIGNINDLMIMDACVRSMLRCVRITCDGVPFELIIHLPNVVELWCTPLQYHLFHAPLVTCLHFTQSGATPEKKKVSTRYIAPTRESRRLEKMKNLEVMRIASKIYLSRTSHVMHHMRRHRLLTYSEPRVARMAYTAHQCYLAMLAEYCSSVKPRADSPHADSPRIAHTRTRTRRTRESREVRDLTPKQYAFKQAHRIVHEYVHEQARRSAEIRRQQVIEAYQAACAREIEVQTNALVRNLGNLPTQLTRFTCDTPLNNEQVMILSQAANLSHVSIRTDRSVTRLVGFATCSIALHTDAGSFEAHTRIVSFESNAPSMDFTGFTGLRKVHMPRGVVSNLPMVEELTVYSALNVPDAVLQNARKLSINNTRLRGDLVYRVEDLAVDSPDGVSLENCPRLRILRTGRVLDSAWLNMRLHTLDCRVRSFPSYAEFLVSPIQVLRVTTIDATQQVFVFTKREL
jgi:hypothetical protein